MGLNWRRNGGGCPLESRVPCARDVHCVGLAMRLSVTLNPQIPSTLNPKGVTSGIPGAWLRIASAGCLLLRFLGGCILVSLTPRLPMRLKRRSDFIGVPIMH